MILLTGSSGFFGGIVYRKLNLNDVKTLSRHDADYKVQLNAEIPVFKEPFELVIHSAGKAHTVPKTQAERQEFFDVNVTGTSNLLMGLENSYLPTAFVFVSTVAVYGKETGNSINEDAPLLAIDAYGRSKIEAEILVQEWCKKNKIVCTILRLPLLAGPNPPGNLKAMINGIKSGFYFNIDGGRARKSIVLADDVAGIILSVSKIGGTYNLTDGYNPNFLELSQVISKQLGKPNPLNMPMFIAEIISKIGNLFGPRFPLNSKKFKKITSDLTFDDSKAVSTFNWSPKSVLTDFKIS